MSTSILYHAFGLKGIKYTATHFVADRIVFSADMNHQRVRCPVCGCFEASFKGKRRRFFFMSPIGRKKCMLELTLHRLKCRSCSALWWPALPFMAGTHRYVRSFALTVLDMLRFATISSVADFLGVGWDLVKNIHKERLQFLYRKIPLHKVECIGIDEFSFKEGHHYMTVVTDLYSGRVLHAVEGKAKEDIRPFLKILARRGKRLEAVAMDMSSAYFWAVREELPKVKVVFDRFHVVSLMNQAIDEFRRGHQLELDSLGQQTLKGSRFLLLRNYDSLEPDRRARLDALLKVNQPLFEIHSMKEQLRLFWELHNRKEAERFLAVWCRDAMNSGIKALKRVGKTLGAYRTGLLNYFDHRITSGAVEGLINKIKTLKRQAYGFRDPEYFKLRLYHLHTQQYSLTGGTR
jgi:transposase